MSMFLDCKLHFCLASSQVIWQGHGTAFQMWPSLCFMNCVEILPVFTMQHVPISLACPYQAGSCSTSSTHSLTEEEIQRSWKSCRTEGQVKISDSTGSWALLISQVLSHTGSKFCKYSIAAGLPYHTCTYGCCTANEKPVSTLYSVKK